MTNKKKKNAARKQQAFERPPSLEDSLDFEPPTSDEEREIEEEGAVADPNNTEEGAVADSTSMEVSSPGSAKERSPSQSSSSDVEETTLETIDDLNVEQLQILLFKAEAKARLRGFAKKEKSPPTLSVGTMQFLRERSTSTSNNQRGRRGSSAKAAARKPSSKSTTRTCTHPTCRSKNNHTVDQCFTRRRELKEAASLQDSPSTQKAKAKKMKKKRKPPSTDDDSE